MVDVEAIKTQNDLAAQVENDLGPPFRHCGCRAYWLCPFHDDHHPSLEVNERQQRWYCPPCGLSGAIIGWVQKYRHLHFRAACERLGTQSTPRTTAPKQGRPEPAAPRSSRDAGPPGADWQAAAWRVVEDCERTLWSDAGAKARDYLHGRGLTDDTLRRWQVGFCPTDRAYHGLYVDRGITIPWVAGHDLWKVNVRTDGQGKPKYRAVKGSRLALYGINLLAGKPDCLVAEGEFDTLLLWQEVGDFADVLSLGSATGRLSDHWLAVLLPTRRFWIATDNDPEGEKSALYWLGLTGERGRRILPPEGAKDVTEAWQVGADLRAWAISLLEQGHAVTQENTGARGISVVLAGDPTPALFLDAEAETLLARRDRSSRWAQEWAELHGNWGIPCYGFDSWAEWAADVTGLFS